MRYIALIYGSEAAYAELTDAERGADWQGYMAFNAEAGAQGVLGGGEVLQPTHTATTVRVRESKSLVTDGPFAETKEQLAGFYILSCADLDEALAWAAKLPGAAGGSVEVRPIMERE